MFASWADFSSPALSALDKNDLIAILPVAAIEQHGPHLPLGTDFFICEGYIARIRELMPSHLRAVVLPIQAVGKSDEHQNFAGTLTLSPTLAIQLWTELGTCIARAGIRRLIILNTHGGNVPVIDLVGRTLRLQHGMLVVSASMHRFGYPSDLFTDHERAHGIHGGDIETSLMLAFKPELVDMSLAQPFEPYSVAMEKDFLRLRANHPTGFAWLSEDLSPEGAMGDPRGAKLEKGSQAAEHGARAFIELMNDVSLFDLSRLARNP